MQSHILKEYDAYFHTKFMDIDGTVLAFIPNNNPPREAKCLTLYDKARHENMENHQHFEFPIGDSVWERWQNNLTLAVSVQSFWTLKLRETFPNRDFVLFIYNEIALLSSEEDEEVLIEIMPTLRMWSKANDPELEMHNGFRVDEAGLDAIVVRENYQATFVPQENVFTKDRRIRKKFLRSMTEDKASRIYLPG